MDDRFLGPDPVDESTPGSASSGPVRPRPGSARKLVRQSTLLVVGRILSKLANFATQVLLVRYLAQSDYGAFAYAIAVVTVLQNLVALGLDRSIVRFLPIFQEQRAYPRLFGTILMAVLVIVGLGIGAAAILFAFQGVFGAWVPDRGTTLGLLLVLVFLAPLQALDDLVVGLFAVFAKARSIFVRRFLLAPVLRLVVALAMVLSQSDVFLLALGYVASSFLGLAIYGALLLKVFRDEGLLQHASFRRLELPWRQVLGFTLPLLTTDLAYAVMNTFSVVMLGRYWGSAEVAALSAVLPAARMNEFVMQTFGILYVPLASRMYAAHDRPGINGLYWRSAAWIAIFSFPILAVTFSLAKPTTVLLFGARYESSAPILAILALAYYFNGATGFNGLTLKVFGRVRALVLISLATIVASVLLSVLLIPSLGALGAGLSIAGSLVVHNLLKQAALRITEVRIFDRRYLRVYAEIGVCGLGLWLVQHALGLPVAVVAGLAALSAWLLISRNARVLEIQETFPEVMRIPGMSLLLRRSWEDAARGAHRATNPRSGFPRAGWLHALPRADVNGILCLGAPRAETLLTLTRRSPRVAVACLSERDVRTVDSLERRPGLAGVERLDWREGQAAGTVPGWVELVVLVGSRARQFMRGERGRVILGAFADRGGLVYFEDAGLRDLGANRFEESRSIHRSVRAFRLLPIWGEPQAVIPASDPETVEYVLRKRLAHPWLRSGLPGRVTRLLSWIPRRPVGYRWGYLIGGPAPEPPGAPPEYLCRLARESEVPLDAYRWGLSIPDAYASRKLVVHLLGAGPSSPSYVAKMVSEPRFNDRLENEARALRALEGMGLADGVRIPRVVFSGQHAGLAIVGETLLQGVRFREKSRGRPDCPYADSAVRLMLDLGRASRAGAAGSELGSSLRPVLHRFDEIYRDGAAREFLERQITALERHPGPVPLVFQHGDPGTHNLLITPGGHAALLDWEAADERGLPLWDLLYFLRSYGVLRARTRGFRSAGIGFGMAFLEESGFSLWARDVVARYCDDVGLEPSLVEPLFYVCWMHRSVKEAARTQDLQRGVFVDLLRRSMRNDARESLSGLFALSRS